MGKVASSTASLSAKVGRMGESGGEKSLRSLCYFCCFLLDHPIHRDILPSMTAGRPYVNQWLCSIATRPRPCGAVGCRSRRCLSFSNYEPSPILASPTSLTLALFELGK